MADTTIFNLTATTTGADGDLLPVVDVSDTAQSAGGSTRKLTFANFKSYLFTVVPTVAQGGTGRATGTTAYSLVATGTTATGAQQTLANGATTEVLVGGGAAALPVWTTATGSGAPVRATSPTLVTPALGTPSSGTLANCTGLPTAGLVDASVTLAKMANLAQDQVIGRTTASTGVPETFTVTAAARTVLDDTTTAAMLTTLGAAPANAPATLSANTTLNRGTHGNRLLICDTAATHSVDDDTGGSWAAGDVTYGINTSAGNVILQGDGTSTVTAETGHTLTVAAGQSWSLSRTGTNAWRGGALDADLMTIAGLTATTDSFMQSKSSAWSSRTVAQVTTDLQGTGSAVDTVGFRGLPQNSQSTAYTTVLADAGKHLYHPGADTTARTWTIDSNANVAYPIGTTLTFVNDTSAGVLTIAITSDTMILAGAGTTGSRTLAANGIATAVKMTSTRWIINGTGLT